MPSTTTDELQPGSLVAVRGQRWVVSEVDPTEGSTLVALQSVEDGRYGDTLEMIWEVEPGTVPVRATAQALIELISEAKHELLLMTYSAKPHDDIRAALTSAVARGVVVTVVVETLQGAGSALAGAEPAAAFSSIPGVQLWHWPMGQRTETGLKMHAKLAVADRRVLFVSSANLTQSGVAKNIEAGLLVRGGHAPRRVTEHITKLTASHVLDRLSVSTLGRI